MPQSPPIRRAGRLGLDVELRAITNRGWRFPCHWHDDLQVIATIQGEGEAFIDGRTYALSTGALVVIPPRAVHTAYATADQGWTFHSLHAAPDRLGPGLAGVPIIGDRGSSMARTFNKVIEALFDKASAPAPDTFEAFVDLVRKAAPARAPVEPDRLAAVTAALEELVDISDAPRTIAAIAASHGLSAGHFSRAFARVCFMSPHAWRLNARVETAKQHLRSGATVAQAATAAGFTNMSQFSRLYRQTTGITARTYRTRFVRE